MRRKDRGAQDVQSVREDIARDGVQEPRDENRRGRRGIAKGEAGSPHRDGRANDQPAAIDPLDDRQGQRGADRIATNVSDVKVTTSPR